MVVLVLMVVWRDKNYKRLYYIYYKNDDDTPSILSIYFRTCTNVAIMRKRHNDDYNTVQQQNYIVETVFKNV